MPPSCALRRTPCAAPHARLDRALIVARASIRAVGACGRGRGAKHAQCAAGPGPYPLRERASAR
eukprot:365733-Chlamydomonas_euryale.AAC.33